MGEGAPGSVAGAGGTVRERDEAAARYRKFYVDVDNRVRVWDLMGHGTAREPVSVDVLRTPHAEDNAAYRYTTMARKILDIRGNPYEVVSDMTQVLEELDQHKLATICAVAITEIAMGTPLRCDDKTRHAEHPWTCTDGERHICRGARGDETGHPPGGSGVTSSAGP
jgi:hypothetical protein